MSHEQGSTPTAVAPRRRRLVGALLLSACALLCAAGLWFASGFATANECRESGYGIADAVEMTGDGCRLLVTDEDGRHLRSEPLPDRDTSLSLAAALLAASAAIPPYALLLRRR